MCGEKVNESTLHSWNLSISDFRNIWKRRRSPHVLGTLLVCSLTNINFYREMSISIAFSIEIDICQAGFSPQHLHVWSAEVECTQVALLFLRFLYVFLKKTGGRGKRPECTRSFWHAQTNLLASEITGKPSTVIGLES